MSRCVVRYPVDACTPQHLITVYPDIFIANSVAMRIANIAEFKNHLSSFLAAVEAGEEVEVRKRNIPVARVVPVYTRHKNRTVQGNS